MEAFAAPSWASLDVGRAWVLTAAAGAGGARAVLLLMPASRLGRGTRSLVLIGGAAAAVLLAPVARAVADRATVGIEVLDVGQGDAILLRSPGRRWLLVDAGPRSGEFDAGLRRIIPVLRRRGIQRLEALLLTHPDLDHLGGAAAVLEGVWVWVVLDPGHPRGTDAFIETLEAAGAVGTPWSATARGMTLRLDGMTVEVLHPDPDSAGALPSRFAGARRAELEPNALSVILLVRHGAFTALLTGDAPREVEERIAAIAGSVQLLKVAHHGSATSSSRTFLERVSPALVLVSVGRGNRVLASGFRGPGAAGRGGGPGAPHRRARGARGACARGRQLDPLGGARSRLTQATPRGIIIRARGRRVSRRPAHRPREAMNETSVVTLARHIVEEERKHPHATGAFSDILYDIALAAKIISREVNKAGLVDVLGRTGKTNVHGEQVQKLDVFADEVMYKAMDHTENLCCMASEEHPDVLPIPERFPRGKYVLLYDPLDGSSNIDVNVSIGTIFSIHRKISKGKEGTLEDCLQPGSRQLAAGYVVYGSSTMLVYTSGAGVHGFTLDPGIGEFLLSHPNMRIPKSSSRTYSINESYYAQWEPGQQRLMDHFKAEGGLSARYIGSLVADVHRTILRGGIFMYPADSRSPQGKLRLLYEAAPLALVCTEAGGAAIDGRRDVLDLMPTELHQKTPLYIGSRDLADKAREFLADSSEL